MNWLQNNWSKILWVLIAIAALILLYILFWPSKVPTSHDSEKRQIDSLISIILTLKSKSDATIKKDSTVIAGAQKKADSLITQTLVLKAQSKTYQARSEYFALLYQTERDKVDTSGAYAACDQIIQLVDSQSMVINTLNALGDSLKYEHEVQLTNKDLIIVQYKALATQTDNTLTTVNKAYQGLNADYKKVVKANKTNRTLSRILALTTLVLGGILLAK